MADIELITDGIAREIIKANDENLKKLVESNEKIKEDIVQTLMRSGEYAVRSFSTPYYKKYNYHLDLTSSWQEIDWHHIIEGKGIVLSFYFSNNSFVADSEEVTLIREIDGKTLNVENTKDIWYPFEEKVEFRHKGKYKLEGGETSGSIRSEYIIHLLLF